MEAMDSSLIIDRLVKTPALKHLVGSTTASSPLHLLHGLILHCDHLNPFSIHRDIDIHSEPVASTIARIVSHLAMLKYSPPSCSIDKLGACLLDDRVIADVFGFLLDGLDAHIQRSYLAPFLTPPSIPVEYQQDPQVRKYLDALRNAQSQFAGVHRESVQMRASYERVLDVKAQLKQIESDRLVLHDRAFKSLDKAKSVGDYSRLVDGVSMLVRERALESELMQRLSGDRKAIDLAGVRLAELNSGLVKARELASLDADGLARKAREDVAVLKQLYSSRSGHELQVKRLHVDSANRFAKSTSIVMHKDIMALEDEYSLLTDRLKVSQDRLAAQNASTGMMKLQAVQQKKRETMARLGAKMAELEQQTKRKSTGLLAGSISEMKDRLQVESVDAQAKKEELDAMSAELSILTHTFATLSEQRDELDRKYGASLKAFNDTSKMSPQQMEMQIRQLKQSGEVLSQQLQGKKTLLTPVVAEMRELKSHAQQLQSSHTDKKRVFDAAVLGLESENMTMAQEINALMQEKIRIDSQLQMLSHSTHILKVQMAKYELEKKYLANPNAEDDIVQKKRGFRLYRDLYSKRIAEAETEQRDLRDTQNKLKESHGPKIQELEILAEIRRIFAWKSKLLQNALKQADSAAGKEKTEDRLVL